MGAGAATEPGGARVAWVRIRGAAVAHAVLDAFPGRGERARELMLGHGRPRVYLTYVGLGSR